MLGTPDIDSMAIGSMAIDAKAYGRQRLVAAIALLQPGIDPVFLVALSHHNGLALADHGLVVASSQIGMAAGALAFAGSRNLPASMLRIAAIVALVAALATVAVSGLWALLAVRALFGIANGFLYAAALAAATRTNPGHAMGTVLLGQLLLATAVALLLPQIAAFAGTGVALAMLAGFAMANVWLVGDAVCAGQGPVATTREAVPPEAASSALVAVFLFVCASMMVWSYIGAEGMVAGLPDTVVGVGVALGSLAGAIAAWWVARASRRGLPPLPVLLGGGFCALAMLSPFVAPAGALGFAGVMVLFNVGATYAVAQFSAHAIAHVPQAGRLVPALHSGGMVAGPLAAAAAMHGGGFTTLAVAVAGVLAAALVALAIDARRQAFRPDIAPQQIVSDKALTQS